MYTIEFDDVDPTTLGFDAREVKRRDDGVYVVERKQFRLSVWNSGGDPIGGNGWCPCSHEIVDNADWSRGGSYSVDGGSSQRYSKNRVIDHLHLDQPSRRYGVDLSADEERDIKKLCGCVATHVANTPGWYSSAVNEGCKIRLGSAPEDPYHDPFLPEKFVKMLGDSYIGG